MKPIDCKGCRACCINDLIWLEPADDLSKYQTQALSGRLALAHKPGTQECIYLTPNGCGVHGEAPAVCKRFDCRVYFQSHDKDWRRMRVEQNPSLRAVFAAGRKRQGELSSHG